MAKAGPWGVSLRTHCPRCRYATVKATPADSETLANLIPFDRCNSDELIVLAGHAWVIELPRGSVLARIGSRDDWDFYLLDGELELDATDGQVLILRAGSETALHPVANLQPRKYTIRAHTAVRCLRVQRQLVASLRGSGARNDPAMTVYEGVAPEQGEHPLHSVIREDLANDCLTLPSLPEVALHIRRMVDDDSVSLPQIAQLVQGDPAISARLMKVANGALFHGMSRVESCTQAIARLGLGATRHLVVGFALRNLFAKEIHDAVLAERLRRLWEHSVEVGAIALVLAQVTPGLNPEEALLVGLLHDIGELVVVTYAGRMPQLVENQAALEAVVSELKAEVGATLLREWHFPEGFVTASREAETWCRDAAPEPDYCDITIVAQLHSFVGTPRMAGLPALAEVPAFGKIAGGALTPHMSTVLLEKAKDQIGEIRQLLLG